MTENAATGNGPGADGRVAVDVLKGMLAGVLATWVMGHVTGVLWQHEDPAARQRYREVTGGEAVPERSAEQVERLLDLHLLKQQEQRLAMGIHWGVGVGGGIMYAVLRRAVPAVDRAQGLLFGLGFWALFDEGATVAFGLAKPPQDYPWQAHARGLVGHLAYGLVADTALAVLDRAAESRWATGDSRMQSRVGSVSRPCGAASR